MILRPRCLREQRQRVIWCREGENKGQWSDCEGKKSHSLRFCLFLFHPYPSIDNAPTQRHHLHRLECHPIAEYHFAALCLFIRHLPHQPRLKDLRLPRQITRFRLVQGPILLLSRQRGPYVDIGSLLARIRSLQHSRPYTSWCRIGT
jgi:hypothetical protein